MKSKKPFDFWIFMTVLILLALGTIMVFSASAPNALNYKGDTYYYLKKQLLMVPLALIAMFITMNVDYRKWGKLSPIILVVSLVLLIMVLIPGIGSTINGTQRWMFGFQPSEIAKLAVILFFSYSLSKSKDKLKSFFKGLFPYLLLLGMFAVLILMEKHLSGTIVVTLTACVILFSAGVKIKHFVILAFPAMAALVASVMLSPYRLDRILSFLDPSKDPKGASWQAFNSLLAIGSGGLFGKGLGKSLQKFLYLPEPQNDFILAILGEELGFIGIVVVMLLFLIFMWRGVKIALNAPDMFGSLLAIGITSLVAVQVVINVAVVTSSVPVTGMPLPFFSYGGTSLIFLMCGIGILLNISKYASYDRV